VGAIHATSPHGQRRRSFGSFP